MTAFFVTRVLPLGAACALAAACGSPEAASAPSERPTAAPPAPAPALPEAAPAPAPPSAPPAAPTTILLASGFAPDPSVVDGTSGGDTDASTLDDACAGWVARSASHVLELGDVIPRLQIMAHGLEQDADLTLVVRAPDGTYLCNDDADGLDPMVIGRELAAGRYEIFVGSYDEDVHQPYRLGFSASEDAAPSALR